MSAGIAAYVVLGVALLAMFAWYERQRPSSRVVALVAALAALAAIGRVAFIALPQVKPTTAVVLVAGYALGPAPGFAVGAVAALSSNVVFGQGPWTPWQMLGWGLVGVLGAAVGALARGRTPAGWVFALAAALAALAFGAVMDVWQWLTFAGERSLAQLGAIAALSAPFDVVHAAASAGFALAFAPTLARAIGRFELRARVHWLDAPAASALVVAVLGATALVATPSPAQAATTAGVRADAVGFLERARNADGGWGASPRTATSSVYTAWAAMGMAAAGQPPGAGAIGVLRRAANGARAVADLERSILALRAAGVPARDARGRDLVAALRRRRSKAGGFAGLVNTTAFAVLALRAAGASPRDPAVRSAGRWIARRQNRDGGWSYAGPGAPSGTDDTAAALQALVAAGRRSSRAARRGVAYLRRARTPAGWPLQRGAVANAQSTAWAVQALLAAGARGPAARGIAVLRALRAADGSIRYSRSSRQTPVWVTGQALAALAGRPLPIVGRGARRSAGGAGSGSARARGAARASAPAGGAGPSSLTEGRTDRVGVRSRRAATSARVARPGSRRSRVPGAQPRANRARAALRRVDRAAPAVGAAAAVVFALAGAR